jgi:2,4-dienoyl-CoA reductase-like NADH-dependent reductase (Old Yellow Enzyme family)
MDRRRANKRTDSYGGSVENRCRFVLEVADVITEVFDGPEMVCVKLNPTDYYNDSVVGFNEMKETYTYLITKLVSRKIGIINLSRRGIDPRPGTETAQGQSQRPERYPLPHNYDPVLDFGRLVKYPGSPSLLMANEDYTIEEAAKLVEDGKLDLISLGRPFIYNPVRTTPPLPSFTKLGLI